MKVVTIEKLTELNKTYKYTMLVTTDERMLEFYKSVNGEAYKFRNYYYIPTGEAKCINDYSQPR